MVYSKPIKTKWWCYYRGQPTVLLEDMSPFLIGEMTDYLKIWADRYAFGCEIKGDTMFLRPDRLCVTSQYRIDDIWKDEETREAMHRRFKEVYVDEVEEMEIRRKEKEIQEMEIDLDEEI